LSNDKNTWLNPQSLYIDINQYVLGETICGKIKSLAKAKAAAAVLK
jgi:hypothetical protein